MKKRFFFILLFVAATVLSPIGCDLGQKDFDILILNGMIVDGSGRAGFRGDVGIVEDTIAEIGDLSERTANTVIDAKNLVVSPGFIDVHTHCDSGLGERDSNVNLNYLIQGVSTVVTGNCGGGIFNVAETKAKWEKQGIGTNVIHLVGFGDIRHAVMGDEPRDPTSEELEKMISIVRKAMSEARASAEFWQPGESDSQVCPRREHIGDRRGDQENDLASGPVLADQRQRASKERLQG